MISSVVHWSFRSILFSFYVFEFASCPSDDDFWFPSLVRQIDALQDFSPIQIVLVSPITDTWFVD